MAEWKNLTADQAWQRLKDLKVHGGGHTITWHIDEAEKKGFSVMQGSLLSGREWYKVSKHKDGTFSVTEL